MMENRKKGFKNLVKNLNEVPKSLLKAEREKVLHSPFRQIFHIESKMGQLNDPNGFSFYNGWYHLFHQSFPLKFTTNPNYFEQGWHHYKSKNLIDWLDLGQSMSNDTKFDDYGVYSGSALQVDSKLFIIYTGNSWVETEKDQWQRKPTQMGAWMDKDNKTVKISKPLINGPLQGYTGHFRDPKVFRINDFYYVVIGAQREDLTGTTLLFRSKDLNEWQKVGEVKTNMEQNQGYMVECPDYFLLDSRGVLIFCPQGLKTKGNHFQNMFQVCYFIGNKMDLATGAFNCLAMRELDNGFNFYAPQTMLSPDGRRLLTAWMSISNGNDPTKKYGYTGCLIFPRELTIKENRLYQQPIQEIQELYTSKIEGKQEVLQETVLVEKGSNARDIKLKISCKQDSVFIFDIFSDSKNERHLRLIINALKNSFIVNREKAGTSFEDEFGTERSCEIDSSQPIKLRIVQDISSAEIFLEDGRNVFSMRVFPSKDQNYIFVNSLNNKTTLEYQINQLRPMRQYSKDKI